MKFTVNAEALKKALDEPLKITRGQNTLNILAHVLLTLQGNRLALYATDYDTTLRADVPLIGDAVDGRLCLECGSLHKVAKLQPKGSDLTFESTADDRDAIITRGKFSVTLVGLPHADYPEVSAGFSPVKNAPAWRASAPTLLDALSRATYCMSEDESRMNLNGSFLTIDGDGLMRWVATDGHRLAMAERQLPSRPGAEPIEAIVHRRSVDSLKRLLKAHKGALAVWEGKSGIVFALSNGTALCGRAIEDAFPEYAKVIPKRNPDPGVLNRKAFMDVVQRVGQLCGSVKVSIITMSAADGELTLTMNNPDGVYASERLSMLGQSEHGLKDCGANWRYILESLKLIDCDEVLFSYLDQYAPVHLEPNDDSERDVHVIMPMRV